MKSKNLMPESPTDVLELHFKVMQSCSMIAECKKIHLFSRENKSHLLFNMRVERAKRRGGGSCAWPLRLCSKRIARAPQAPSYICEQPSRGMHLPISYMVLSKAHTLTVPVTVPRLIGSCLL